MIFKNTCSARQGFGLFVALICLSLPLPATAQNTADTGKGDIMPVTSTSAATATEYEVAPGEETHPPVRLSPDKTEMVKLEEDADSVIIGNPAHVNLVLNNPRLMLLTSGTPGATQITILNRSGKVIMQRHVISSGPQEQYIRVRRSCINGGSGCTPNTVYYCPSGSICHDVQLTTGQGGANSGGIPGSNDSSSARQEPSGSEVPEPASNEEDTGDFDPNDTDEGTSPDENSSPSQQ